ncbi:MAG: ABC transporter ATP-binding protein [Paracoccus sp. (in: a-proteobacteria)]|nr:ABC transporter ATP-binding protein [Paracoccus sp. (in: a-proteobacteria)]
MDNALLDIDGLNVTFRTGAGPLHAVRGASLKLRRGETIALVGESGSGKSTLAKALIRANEAPFTAARAEITGRAILDAGDGARNLVTLDRRQMRAVRAQQIAMISQDALSGLNPVLTIGWQVAEALATASPQLDRRARKGKTVALLAEVGLPTPAALIHRYPHQLSGGQRQRVMIAMAVARNPALLIADEPTTALDVTVQARILTLLRDLQARSGVATLFITHDLGVVARVADRVAVMYAGEIVEVSPVADFLRQPRHPYTSGLLASVPGSQRQYPRLKGYAPAPDAVPEGCAFRTRCPIAGPACTAPQPIQAAGNRLVRCWRAAA